MDKDSSRNMTIFVVVTIAILALYEIFVVGPRQKQRDAEMRAQATAAQTQAVQAPGAATYMDRAQAVAATPRVTISTPVLQGSVSLKGGRIDDLFLKNYRETINKNSPPVELFRPEGAKQAYFTEFGWTGQAPMPGPLTVWKQTGGAVLAPGKPIALSWDNGQGLTFLIELSVDDDYMFTVRQSVKNATGNGNLLAGGGEQAISWVELEALELVQNRRSRAFSRGL